MKTPPALIELLEPRVAPATLTGNILTYKDLDGDVVKVTFSGAAVPPAEANFTFNDASAFANANPVQLQLIDLKMDAGFTGANIAVSVTKAATGDGFANIGYINGKGVDLGTVSVKGDLGRIDAGKSTSGPKALVALNVASMGRYGLATQGGAGFLESNIDGPLGVLNVTGDLVHEFISLLPANIADGTIGSINIKGSIVGGPMTGDGSISATAEIGPVKIGKNIIGGAGVGSGQIHSSKTIGPVTLGGSLLAGPTGNGGQILGETGIGDVSIKGDIRGGEMSSSGFIRSQSGPVGKVTVGGSLIGGKGNESGKIVSFGPMGAVKISKHIIGGDGIESASINSADSMGDVAVGGSLIGGSGTNSGVIVSFGNMGAVKIAGDMLGGSGAFSTEILTTGTGNIKGVSVGGSILAANGFNSFPGILSNGSLGLVTVKGSITGTDETPIYIIAKGNLTPPAGALTNVAIAGLKVGGSVERVNIFAGFDFALNAVNGHVQIGAISAGGDWIASNVTAGVENLGTDNQAGGDTIPKMDNLSFGDSHDHVIAGGPAAIVSAIASITVKGLLIGSGGVTNDHFGFSAQHVGSAKFGGLAVALTAAGKETVNLSPFTGNDVTIHELA